MRLHLRILYGADDRFQIVKNTIDVCYNYFDTIRIVNSGPPELAQQFKTLPPNTTIETLNFFFGDLESARNSFLYDVNINDYVMWLDADERPTQFLLDNIYNIIDEIERRKIWGVVFPGTNHLWEDSGKCLHEEWNFNDRMKFPFDAEDCGVKWSTFFKTQIHPIPVSTIGRMVKKCHYFTSANTNFGGHGNILNYKNDISMFYVRFPINHYKYRIMEAQSYVTCTYVNPCLNAPIKNGYKPYIDSQEFKRLRGFQIKTKVKTQNDLCKKLHLNLDLQFKNEFKELLICKEFLNSNLYDNFFKLYHLWAEKYDVSWKTPYMFCGKQCCKYKNIQL
jgi:hypothetical protein